MHLNKKGMTLIEVIVVLMLSSILMVIAGGLLLNSMGYFNETAQSNYEKQAVDAISSYVREQLVYASEVQIATQKPDKSSEWHWISVNDENQLMKDDNAVYNNDFYRSRALKITAKCYSDNYRLDLSFAFADEQDKQVYRTGSTLELVNIKAKDKKGEAIVNAGIKGKQVVISDHDNAEAGYKIYYKLNGSLKIVDDPDYTYPEIDYDDPAFEGTVYDELKCKEESVTKPGEAGNNKGTWLSNHDYKKGDFVDYLGVTYRAIKDAKSENNPLDNKGNAWKPINPPYWVKGASYEKDDVVIYQITNTYYQAKLDVNNSNDSPDNDNNKWHKLSTSELKEIIEEHKSKDFCEIKDKEEGDLTVGGEMDRCSDSKVVYGKNAQIYKGDYVEYPTGSKNWYRYVGSTGPNPMMPNDQTDQWAPDIQNSLWKKIDINWTTNSVYFYGDIIYDQQSSKYYQMQQKGEAGVTAVHRPEYDYVNWSIGYKTLEELLNREDFIDVACKVYK